LGAVPSFTSVWRRKFRRSVSRAQAIERVAQTYHRSPVVGMTEAARRARRTRVRSGRVPPRLRQPDARHALRCRSFADPTRPVRNGWRVEHAELRPSPRVARLTPAESSDVARSRSAGVAA